MGKGELGTKLFFSHWKSLQFWQSGSACTLHF